MGVEEEQKLAPITGTVDVTISPPKLFAVGVVHDTHKSLLDLAARLIAEGKNDGSKWGASMLITQAAKEIYLESIFEKFFAERQWKPMRQILRRDRDVVADERILGAYEMMSGNDQLNQQAFWGALKDGTNLRNKVAHAGLKVSEEPASLFLAATRRMIAYLEGIHR